MSSIFRTEALAAQNQRFDGEPAALYPLSAGRVLGLLLAMAGIGLGFLVFAPYTDFGEAPGIVSPRSGQALIVAEQRGRFWSEHGLETGRKIRRGDRLGWIDVAANATAVSSLPDTSLNELKAKRRNLMESSDAGTQALQTRLVTIAHQVEMLEGQRTALQEQRQLVSTRLALKEGEAAQYAALKASGFVTSQYMTGLQDEVVALKATLAEMRQRMATLDQKHAELRELELVARDQGRKERSNALQEAAEVDSRIAAATANRRLEVLADRDMVITAVHADNGGWVVADDPLLSATSDTDLWIHCLVDGRTIVHVKPGMRVRIRYPSYPSLVHGTFEGEVEAVERSPWMAGDATRRGLGELQRETSGGALFKIAVRPLPSADGQPPVPLVNGMQAQVLVPRATRTLLQWLFLTNEPDRKVALP